MIKITCNRCGCKFDVRTYADILKPLSTRIFECPNCRNQINGGYDYRGSKVATPAIEVMVRQIVEQWCDDNEFIDLYNDSDDRNFIVFNDTREDLIKKLTRALTPGEGISGY